MAAITMTTPTFLDGGTARVAGDTYNVNGTTFTIRTDTRVHANAPAAMTGSLSNTVVSQALGGTIVVEGSNVRWMAYDTGTGNVPTIGTSITQGGVTGYLLGVWPDYQSAPTVPGAAMPATGFLKFREVTGGPYSAGALTGIGASASSPDVTGWIEIAMDSNTSFQPQELGGGVQVNGTWFYLDNTNGTRGQQIKVPTNGGGAGTHVFAVQIETSAGSGVYEWFPTAGAVGVGGAMWTAANMSTDGRAKLVESMGNGVIRIGSDGTINLGHLPPTGCKVRIPNVFGRTVTTAARATNQVPGAVTRAGMTGGIGGGNYTITGWHGDFTFGMANVAHVELRNFVSETVLSISNNRDPVVINNLCLGGFTSGTAITLNLATLTNATITDIKIVAAAVISGIITLSTSSQVTMTNAEAICVKTRTSLSTCFNINNCKDITLVNFKSKGARNTFDNCINLTLTGFDFTDRVEGATTINTAVSTLQLGGMTDSVIDGITFGDNGSLVNAQPYGSLISFAAPPSKNLKVRNAGTRVAPLDSGTSATFYPLNIIATPQAGSSDMKFQRLYLTGTRTNPFLAPGISDNSNLYEDIFGSFANTNALENGRNAIFRKIGVGNYSASVLVSNAGTHWTDHFTSDTAGAIRWYGQAPSPQTADKNFLQVTANVGTGYIGNLGAISLDTANDAAYSESQWNFLGHTGFQNVAPTVIGTQLIQTVAPVGAISLIVGTTYTIVTVGGSNFISVGASSNTVGTVFTATGTSAGGSGTATTLLAGIPYTITTVGTSNFVLMGASANTVGTVFIPTTLTTTSLAGTGGFSSITMHYQLDTGSGYSGTWTYASPALLSAETIPATGFKMKLKILQGISTPGIAISSITFSTTSTLAAQANNQYPLDVVTLTLEGLVPGTEVRAYVGTDPSTAVQIGGTESSATSFSFTHTSSGQAGYIHIFALGYQPIIIPRTYATEDSSLLIQQVIDRNYYNN